MTHYSLLSTALCAVLMSFIHSGLTQDTYISTLTVTPNTVFTGERVRLTCVITPYYSDWRYDWWRGDTYYTSISQPERYTVEENTLTIEGSESSDTGDYWCRGRTTGGYLSSQSISVSLSVKDLPKTELSVDPKSRVFTGETVNLKCVIESYSAWRQRNGLTHDQRYYWTPDWSYEWYKGTDSVKLQSSDRYTVNTDTLTIRRATTSDAGQFWCKGQRDGRPNSSQESERIDLAVNDLPKPTLIVTPDTVFTGETVNLKCVIESYSVWRYEWKRGYPYYTSISQSSQRLTVDRNTLTIEGSESSDTGQYTCKGRIEGRSVSSQSSSAVSLSVKALPRSTLTVTPDKTVFTGERVILTCVINSDHRDWKYEWNKYRVKLQSSDRYTVDRNTLTIRAVTTSDEGQYTCRGHIEGRSVSSQSSSVSLSVKALPRSTLTVTPDNTVFTGERVNLKCVIESNRDWRYEWNKDSVKLQSSDRYTLDRNTLTIEGSESYDAGQYTCRGHIEGRSVSSQSSSAVSLSVKDLPKTKLTVDPKSPVFIGETVNLKCVIESNHTDWRYEWYKDSVKLQWSERYTVNTDTLTIRGATESDRGQYTCRGQRDGRSVSSQESERINLSVNAASSSRLVTGVVVGSSVCLLFFLSLLLMWRYKKNKDQQRNINQTSVPNQSAQPQLENFPLESDSDHIYDDVTEVNKRDKDDSDPLTDVTYSEVTVTKKMDKAKAESNNVTYSEVGKRGKKCKSKDINPAGPSDLTYAQINIQDKKKTKGKGKSSESGDTLYSELKQNTDRDADAGVGDTTFALAFWKKGQKKINKTCP